MVISIYLILTGLAAGFLGSIIGIGGGIIIVPVLSLLLKIPIQNAIGTSLLAVMATSISASRLFFKRDLSNLRAGLALVIFTTTGAITGSLLVVYVKTNILFGLFGLLTMVSAYFTYRKNLLPQKDAAEIISENCQDLSTNHLLELNSTLKIEEKNGTHTYYDAAIKRTVSYQIKNYPIGFTTSFFAGIMSGLLGIGGGFINVSTMNLLMNVPLKAATATSTFMIGITAAASSIIYVAKGLVIPDITASVVIGVLLGGTIGSFLACYLKNKYIVIILLIIFIVFGINMILKAFGINVF